MMHLKDFEDSPTLEKSAYDIVEKDLQERLYILFSEASKQKFATILILEGWAGSGKGDLLKSITTRLDRVDSEFTHSKTLKKKTRLIIFYTITGIDFLYTEKMLFSMARGIQE
jgi:polyphosphate kinase 2 (PPK2 family)